MDTIESSVNFLFQAGEWSDVPEYIVFMSVVLVQIWMISIFGENVMVEVIVGFPIFISIKELGNVFRYSFL
jgi:hypothetical protein